jgi:hypothetical protein
VRGRLGYSGGVVAEASASINGEATGREAVDSECAGDGMGGTMVMTGGPGLPEGEWREREMGGAADRWGRVVRRGVGARSWAAWAVGGAGGGRGRGAVWAENGPAEGKGVFLFLFLFSISLPFSIFVYFYFLFF